MNLYYAIGFTLLTIILGIIPMMKFIHIGNYLMDQKKEDLFNICTFFVVLFIIVTGILGVFTVKSWYTFFTAKTPKYYNNQFSKLIEEEKAQHEIDVFNMNHMDYIEDLKKFFEYEFTAVDIDTRQSWCDFFYNRSAKNNAHLDFNKIKKDMNTSNVVEITYEMSNTGYKSFSFIEKNRVKLPPNKGCKDVNCICQNRWQDKKKTYTYQFTTIMKYYDEEKGK